ncbi:MAG TPA: glycosyltransferase family 2 protein [Candidatus Acidoferrales bacterium]|jgi:biofilm PGA synthesis N-glycosyltransferase PgaC|nr:glycosyltransferase family 2 protein [Candidatus Acidoferrales bacterium]
MFPVTVFLLSAAFCLYTLAGYPLLLGLRAWWRPRPIVRAAWQARVSVILPVHNGERWIGAKLDSILALNYPPELVEILVVSDGSTDATESIAGKYARKANIHLLAIPRQGKAAAINAALERAQGEILFFTDVRQQLDRESLRNLVACFADPAVGVASGELVIREGEGIEEASVGLYWKYEKWIRKQLSSIDSVLGATGCIYAMRRNLARHVPAATLADDMYLPLAAFFQGYRIILENSALAYDFPTQLSSEFRRKVRTLAGVYQIVGQYPALLGPSNRMWIHFLSHKLARLAMPYALIAAAAASFALPGPWDGLALAVQALFYAAALADYWLPGRNPLKRITSPVRTFTVLMAASLCAVSILFVPSRILWKETQVGPERQAG